MILVYTSGARQKAAVVEYDVAVWLWEKIDEAKMFTQEWEEFWRGPVVRQVLGLNVSFTL